MDDDVLQKVRGIISESIPLSGEDIRLDAGLSRDLGLSSLELVMLTARIEATFQVQFPPEDMAALVTVGNLVDAVRQRTR